MYCTWCWLLWNCSAWVWVRFVLFVKRAAVCCDMCMCMVYIKSVFYHSALFSCFILHTHRSGSIRSAQTHTLLAHEWIKNALANQIKCNSTVHTLSVQAQMCGNVFADTMIIMNVKSLWHLHVMIGHKYKLSHFLLLREWSFYAIKMKQHVRFHFIYRNKQIPLDIKYCLKQW